MKVSFVIPVYKVEKYLDECVQSILKQTYRDYEILLVDDGSPDLCPEMCDHWARVDDRIKTLHKPNGGLSDARNYGLRHAMGEYIVFIDSDDFWCHDDDLQKLMAVAEKNPQVDFVGYNCQYYYEDKNAYFSWIAYSDELSALVTGDKAIQLLVKSGTFPMSACLKLMKRSTLVDGGISFKKGQIAEDIPWFINLLDKSKNCMFVNEYVYAYRQNVAGSITASGGERSFNSLFDILKTEIKRMDSRSFSQEAKDALYSFLAYEFCILLTMSSCMPKEKRKDLLQYKWLLKYTANPKVRKAALVNKFFGIKVTEWVLKYYTNHVRK